MGLEFFAIIIGVLIALNVDEWREQRQIAEMNDIAVERLNERYCATTQRSHAAPILSKNVTRGSLH